MIIATRGYGDTVAHTLISDICIFHRTTTMWWNINALRSRSSFGNYSVVALAIVVATSIEVTAIGRYIQIVR